MKALLMPIAALALCATSLSAVAKDEVMVGVLKDRKDKQVTVVLRELPTNRVVYETHSSNEGPLLDSRTVLPAMFDAAMQGFPVPAPGPRRVDIQLGARP